MTVAELPDPLATLPTEDTTPGVIAPSGRVIAHLVARPSPRVCCAASRSDRDHRPVPTSRSAPSRTPGEPSDPATVSHPQRRGLEHRLPERQRPGHRQAQLRPAAAAARTRSPAEVIPARARTEYRRWSAYPSCTRSRLSWATSWPVIPSDSARHAGTRPYSSNTGTALSVPVQHLALADHPAGGGQPGQPSRRPSPPPCTDPAYPSVAFTLVCDASVRRVTTAVEV